MTRYRMSFKLLKKFIDLGYDLTCHATICLMENRAIEHDRKDCSSFRRIEPGHMVESRPRKYGPRKFYHAECYDASFIDTGEDND